MSTRLSLDLKPVPSRTLDRFAHILRDLGEGNDGRLEDEAEVEVCGEIVPVQRGVACVGDIFRAQTVEAARGVGIWPRCAG